MTWSRKQVKSFLILLNSASHPPDELTQKTTEKTSPVKNDPSTLYLAEYPPWEELCSREERGPSG